MNLYKITTSSNLPSLCNITVYVLAKDETTACDRIRETFRKWEYGDVECAVIELLGKEGHYPEPCDYLFICNPI